jgi:hypothetical protein
MTRSANGILVLSYVLTAAVGVAYGAFDMAVLGGAATALTLIFKTKG